ncbi:MAG: hypothetical protein L6R28_07835 [Planctomycetes bacterium]|nr:hypothetical protein [Planctomycetota bacterium]
MICQDLQKEPPSSASGRQPKSKATRPAKKPAPHKAVSGDPDALEIVVDPQTEADLEALFNEIAEEDPSDGALNTVWAY